MSTLSPQQQLAATPTCLQEVVLPTCETASAPHHRQSHTATLAQHQLHCTAVRLQLLQQLLEKWRTGCCWQKEGQQRQKGQRLKLRGQLS